MSPIITHVGLLIESDKPGGIRVLCMSAIKDHETLVHNYLVTGIAHFLPSKTLIIMNYYSLTG